MYTQYASTQDISKEYSNNNIVVKLLRTLRITKKVLLKNLFGLLNFLLLDKRSTWALF